MVARQRDPDQVPKWAVKAIIWAGTAMFTILISVIGWIGMQFDTRLNRIESLLLHSPSVTSVKSPADQPGIISFQENPHSERYVDYP